MSDFTTTHKHRSLKHRVCIWCGENIAKGTFYFRNTGVFNGDFQDNHYHLECWDAASTFFRLNPGESFGPWEFKRGTTEER